eukprot:XP_019072667.1 PREDICTED: uncharacterized protein LOC109121821 [Vitis vinifera]
MASQSPNIGCSQLYFHVIEIAADKVGYVVGKNRATIGGIQQSSGAWIWIESGECTPGTYRRVHLGGTREQIQSAEKDIYEVLGQCPDRRVNPIPHRHLPEPSSYGYINRPGLRPESQAAGSYPAHSSYYGDSSTQPSLWGPMPSPSGRHAAPSPGSLSIHPSNLGNHPIQPAAQYQANPSGRHPTAHWPGSLWNHPIQPAAQDHSNPSGGHPAVPWPGSLWNHPIQPAAQYQANPSAMPPAPWPGSDLPSSSSANYGYHANPSTTPATSQSGTCPAPLFDTTNNPPTHVTTQSQTTTSGMPSESSREIIPATQLHHNNPIQPEAGDEAYSSAMHASTSRKHQRK